jgi:hypothetical protein
VDRHIVSMPDPDAVPDPDPDWHQNDADPHVDLTPSFTQVGNKGKNLLLFATMPVYNVFTLSLVAKVPSF